MPPKEKHVEYASVIGARCPKCHSELPLIEEQALFLSEGKPVWLFCPVCSDIVAAQRFSSSSLPVRGDDWRTMDE